RDVFVGLRIGSGQFVAVDVRDDSSRRKQRVALLLALDGRGTAARALDVRPAGSRGSVFAHPIAALARCAGGLSLLSIAALRAYYDAPELRAQRHQRRLECPGVAALDDVRKAAAARVLRRKENDLTTTIATAKKVPVTVAYGDGIGPEIMTATLRV